MNPTYRKIDTDFIRKKDLTDEEWEKQKKINAKKREEQMRGPAPPKSKSPSPPPDTGNAPPDKRVEHPDDENVEERLDDLESKMSDDDDPSHHNDPYDEDFDPDDYD